MKRARGSLAALALLLALSVVGCSGKPYWVRNQAPKNPDPDKLYAVGIAPKGLNERMQLTTARTRAKQELASNIDTYVAELVKDFMQTAQDFADGSADSSISFTSAVRKTVTAAKVRGVQELDKYKEEDGTLNILMAVPKSAIHEHMIDRANQLARMREAQAKTKPKAEAEKMIEQTNEALGDLKKFIEDKEARK